MKALVIPDIHLKPWLFDRAEKILNEGKAELAVCLMDIPDDWGMELSVEQYRDTFDRAISFAEAYPETLWCYGNHDVSYPWGKLETGYSPYAERTVISKLDELKDSLQKKSQIAFIHRIDNVLFMHGGLTAEYVGRLNPELLNADIDDVLEAANSASDKYMWNDESPLWFRPQYKEIDAFRREHFIQVVGHTPVKNIYEKNGFISTDVFSTYSDGRQIGESAMIIIDTETRKYEKVPVMGKLGYKVCTVTVGEEDPKT